MSKLNDLTGKRFGRLIVVSVAFRDNNRRYKWLCRCDCGNEKQIFGISLTRGLTVSCGCYNNENRGKSLLKHGQSKKRMITSEYKAWCEMKKRCYDPNYKRYDDYGGRGINICDRWLNSFENFFKDMGKKPSPQHSLDRYPNNDGNYEPSNCRWATKLQQAGNKRSNNWIEQDGIKMILEDWVRETGINKNTVKRLIAGGWPLCFNNVPSVIVLDTETGIFFYSIREAAAAKGINISNLNAMLNGRMKNNTSLIKA